MLRHGDGAVGRRLGANDHLAAADGLGVDHDRATGRGLGARRRPAGTLRASQRIALVPAPATQPRRRPSRRPRDLDRATGATFAAPTACATPPRASVRGERVVDQLAARQRNEDDGSRRDGQPERAPPARCPLHTIARAKRDSGGAAGVAPAEVVVRLGCPLVGDERLQTWLAARAPAQVELRQLVAALAKARRRERTEDPLARIRARGLAPPHPPRTCSRATRLPRGPVCQVLICNSFHSIDLAVTIPRLARTDNPDGLFRDLASAAECPETETTT